VIRALCHGGASPNKTDGNGETPMHRLVNNWRGGRHLPDAKLDAKTQLHLATLKALLDCGADPWLINHQGKVRDGQRTLGLLPETQSRSGDSGRCDNPSTPLVAMPAGLPRLLRSLSLSCHCT
jgi:hypothetical protein